MDRQQVQAVFDLLPNSHYNSVFVVGNVDEVIEILSDFPKKVLKWNCGASWMKP